MTKAQYVSFIKCDGQPGIQCPHLEMANDTSKQIPFFVSKETVPFAAMEGLAEHLTEGFVADARRFGVKFFWCAACARGQECEDEPAVH